MVFYFRMSVSANHTICDQILTMFLSIVSANETAQCISPDDGRTPPEILFIIGLLLAPISACLTVAMFVFMVSLATTVSDTFATLITHCRYRKTKRNSFCPELVDERTLYTDLMGERMVHPYAQPLKSPKSVMTNIGTEDRSGSTENIVRETPEKPPRYKTNSN